MDRWWQQSDQEVKEIIQEIGPRRCTSENWLYDNVRFSVDDSGLARVKFDDQANANGITAKFTDAMLDIAVELHRRPEVKVVLFTAAGAYFCTGGAFAATDEPGYGPLIDPKLDAFEKLVLSNKPIGHLLYLLSTLPQLKVASIRGGNLGAGVSLIAAMDYVVCPERKTTLTFLEAQRGLAACPSWQGGVSKLGVMRMRRFCLLSDMLDAEAAQRMGLVDELIEGAASYAFSAADARAEAKAKASLLLSDTDRQALKTTGPLGCRNRLLPLPAAVRGSRALQGPVPDWRDAVTEILDGCGRKGRPAPARLSRELWPHEEVELEMAGQGIALITLHRPTGHVPLSTVHGLLDALVELHKSVGKVRVAVLRVQAGAWTPPEDQEAIEKLQQAIFLLYMLPMYALGLAEGRLAGAALPLYGALDCLLADREAVFDFSCLDKKCPGVEDILTPRIGEVALQQLAAAGAELSAEEAKEHSLVAEVFDGKPGFRQYLEGVCEKASACAPNAVAQSKAFLQQIGASTLNRENLAKIVSHVARRQMDPEFEDSVRQVIQKDHVPAYNQPCSRVVPQHLVDQDQRQKADMGYAAQAGLQLSRPPRIPETVMI
eukprot:TRINITY_DN31060_c0_g1_i1.p1 TRINITY_DN31060_c0_g1~~TRINITY_DN31060_c0_g1_i1.p1  ORF type:complete len:603 (+),score=112.48 TRINITY_DN31060_c0_g1_i1:23-1831(+)